MGYSNETVIGICGGVGPAAGLLLHQNILSHTENHGTDQGHLDVVHISRSRDTVDRTAFLLGKEDENPAVGMARTLDMMRESTISRKASAIVGVPCNTFHAAPIWNEFERLCQENQHETYRIKLVHMLDETVKSIGRLSPTTRRVGLLSTTGTRESRVYHELLEPKGYDVVEVSEEMQAQVHKTIYHPAWGIKATAPVVSQRAIENFHAFARVLAKNGAQVIILGCTEIPFAFEGVEKVEGAILIDPMVALARGLIREACRCRLKPMMLKSSTKRNSAVIDVRKPTRTNIWAFYHDFVDKMLMTVV